MESIETTNRNVKEKGQTNVTETILAAMVNMHINYLCRTNLNHRETRQLI